MQITKLQKLQSPNSKSKRIIKEDKTNVDHHIPKRKFSKSTKLLMKGKNTIIVSPNYSRIDSHLNVSW